MKPIKTLIALQVALLAVLSAPAGAVPPLPRGAEIKVNTNTVAWHYDPSVAVFPDGGFVVVFTAGPREQEPGRRVIHARFFDRQGKPASGQFRLIDRVAGSQFVDQVIADRDGSFLVVWTETVSLHPFARRRVFVRRFNRDGTPRGARIQVHAPSALDRSGGVLALAPNGRFAVAWQSTARQAPGETYTNAMVRVFTAQGEPVTDEILVLEGDYGIGDNSVDPAPAGLAVGPDGTLNVLTQTLTQPDIITTELIRLSPDGGFWGVYLNTFACCLIPDWGASLAMSRDGSVMVTWTDFRITAKRFTPDGVEGNDFFVTPHSTERQNDPVIAQHADGGFVIAWTDADRWGNGIFGRTFDADGTPLTGRFRISKTIVGDQQSSAIAASSQGPIVVVWEQVGADGRADIYARILK